MTIFSSLQTILNHPHNQNNILATLIKIIWWKCNQIFFKLPVIAQVSKTKRLICYPDSSYGSFVIYAKYPEYHELKFLEHYLRSDDVVFDVGSHIGHYIVLASEVVEKGSLVAFEPTPKNYHRILENVALNAIQNSKVEQMAVGSKNGTAQFLLENESEVNRLSDNSESGTKANVKITTLDSYCGKKKIKLINFLKIDTEGAEADVLLGAQKLIFSQKIPVILFELNPKVEQYKEKKKSIFSILNQANYHYFILNNSGKWKKLPSNKINPSNTINVLAILHKECSKNRIKLSLKV